MAVTEEIKSRILRAAVQDNVNVINGVRVARARPRINRKQVWLWSGLLTTVIAFLTLASAIIPQSNAPTVSALPVRISTPVAEFSDPEVLASPPRPIDREAIPFKIKTIVIDAGHGGDPGTTAESGMTEKEITLDLALRLRRLLKDAPFKVLLTRDRDQRLSLDRRVAFANENKADLFLSIHLNWMEPHSIRAVETYYVGPTDDPAILKLASRENKESGYSLADYKKILEKIYVDTRRHESHILAATVHSQLFDALKKDNPDLENRGVKTAPFVVLIGTEMPAILIEAACLSNPDDVALLTNGDYRESIALALARGIKSYANSFNRVVRKGS
ncbi:MAG: N-acetylmuramoyl-L-alanine amidase family protein [Chloroflexota bacterium]